MRSNTQALLLARLGAVLLRLSATDEYLLYVTSWMKWPLLVSGVALLGLGLGPILGAARAEGHDHDHGVPRVTWLLLLPGVVTFVVAPPQLGSFLAERRAGEAVQVARPDEVTELSTQRTIPLSVDEFLWRAQGADASMEDQPVRLTGFVSHGAQGAWYVTRMAIGCCAADAVAYRIEVRDAGPRPARDQWVSVTGIHVPGSGADGSKEEAAVVASSVEPTTSPSRPYR